MKLWPLALGAGMIGGAVTVMMLPRSCTARQTFQTEQGRYNQLKFAHITSIRV